MFHWLTQTIDIPNPTFKLFDGLSGVDNLDPSLTINGTTVTPTFRYNGKDATATEWNAWVYGVNLTTVIGSGGAFNQGSPLLGANDDSVDSEGTRGWTSPSANDNGIGTGDIVFELVAKAPVTSNTRLFTNRDASNSGFEVFAVSSDRIFVLIGDSGGQDNYGTTAGTFVPGYWYHVMIFINRDEASTDGARFYINGVEADSGRDFSSKSGSLASTDNFDISHTDSTNFWDGNIAYIAMWQQADWHQAGASSPTEWATIAQERFNRLIGIHPSKAIGTATPTVQTRNTSAYLDKLEGGVRKLYQVGPNWLRMVDRNDSRG